MMGQSFANTMEMAERDTVSFGGGTNETIQSVHQCKRQPAYQKHDIKKCTWTKTKFLKAGNIPL